VQAALDGVVLSANHEYVEDRMILTFDRAIDLSAGKKLTIKTRQIG
jgi:hypothetical protein